MSWFVVATEVGGTAAADVGVAALGSEFGTTALFSELGAGGMGELMGLGSLGVGSGAQTMSGVPSLMQQATATNLPAVQQITAAQQAAATPNIASQVAQFGQTGIPQAFNSATQLPQVPVVDMAGTPVAQTTRSLATQVPETIPRVAEDASMLPNSNVAQTVPRYAEDASTMLGTNPADKSLLDKFMAQPLQNQLLMGSLGLQALPVVAPMLKNLFGGSSGLQAQEKYSGPLSKYKFVPGGGGYNPAPPTPYTPQYTNYRTMAEGGQVPSQSFFSAPFNNAPTAPMQTGGQAMSNGLASLQPNDLNDRYAQGGLSHLGSYSDGGRMLKGPGDGMSDSIPATINNKQPARLANDEFVVPADVVSHLGNGSSDAGAKQLYKMMDKVRAARTGTKKQGKQINPSKYLPA